MPRSVEMTDFISTYPETAEQRSTANYLRLIEAVTPVRNCGGNSAGVRAKSRTIVEQRAIDDVLIFKRDGNHAC